MDDPTRHLTPAHAESNVSDGYVNPTGFFDALSLTHWLNEAILGLSGRNLLDELVTPFTGDWQAFAMCGQALANAADCLAELGQNVQYSAYQLDPAWDGNAADAAQIYFTNLAVSTSHLQASFDKAADEYQRTARGVWLAADTVSGLIKQIIDDAIIGMVAAAAGTIVSETGVGAVLGYGVAALQVTRILEKINRAGLIVTKAGLAIDGSFGFIMAMANQSGHLNGVDLPPAGYDHPAVP